MVSSLLLEPLPLRDADQLVTMTSPQPQGGVNPREHGRKFFASEADASHLPAVV